MEKHIVKVQTPLTTNDPQSPALIYGRGKKYLRQQVLPTATLEKMVGSPKAFFYAIRVGGIWVIGDRAPDQTW